jgi:hypothetical protein
MFVEQINARFGDAMEDEELCVATMVDPRYRDILFSIDPDQKARAVEWAVDAMEKRLAAVAPPPPVAVTATVPAAASASTPDKGAPGSSGLFAKFARAVANSPGNTQKAASSAIPVRARDSLQRELELYLEEQLLPHTSCPLTWWRAHQLTYPAVAEVARHILCVPATSVPSERLFSKAGDVITKKRNSLEPKKAEQIIFIMDN